MRQRQYLVEDVVPSDGGCTLVRLACVLVRASLCETVRVLRQVQWAHDPKRDGPLATAADPVGQGFIKSYRRPGGNITGIMFANTDIKVLELVKIVMPGVSRIGVMLNPARFLHGRGCGGQWPVLAGAFWRGGTVKWPVTRPPRDWLPAAPPSITARWVSRSSTSRPP